MEDALKGTYQEFETDSTFADKLDAANRFGLIAGKWNDQWVTHYYAAYSQIIMSFMEKDDKKKDLYLDEADKQIEKIKALLKTDNDEVYVLAALVANARIAINPASRWQKYGNIFDENLTKAKNLQPNNPRIYYLQGMSKYHTPKMFGGGAKNAISLFEKADELYKNESSDNISKPFWGKKQNSDMLATCKKEVDN
jgi:hypothetical protein